MTEPRELTWAKDEVIKEGGSIIESCEEQMNGSIWHLQLETKDGKPVRIKFDLTAILPENCVREAVREAITGGLVNAVTDDVMTSKRGGFSEDSQLERKFAHNLNRSDAK
jgi:hypothetical protein